MKKTTIAALLSAAFLGACGGGSSNSTGNTTTTPPVATTPTPVPEVPPVSSGQAGTSVGVFTDSPVAGIQYVTSGGYSSVTGVDGRFAYNPGETITFKIGATTLGTVPAMETVTPLDLAATATTGAENLTTNLLVLLQSLDADGDPSNGIVINAATRTAAASAGPIDLTLAPAVFASSTNATLTSLMVAAGLPRATPTSSVDALAHFKAEFFKQLNGVWWGGDADNVVVARFDASGKYLEGEAGVPGQGLISGAESGTLDYDPRTGKVSATSYTYDGNADGGFSYIDGSKATIKITGDSLVLRDMYGVTTFHRVKNVATSIIGTWAASPTATNTQTLTLFDNGTFLFADPLGDTEHPSMPCSSGGVEFGTYSFNASTNVLVVAAAPKIDTNGCAGMWDKNSGTGVNATVVFNDDKSTFTVEGTTFYRVSK